jgi:hypothetical protein
MGVNRKRPHLGNAGMGDDDGQCGDGREPETAKGKHLLKYLRGLAERMREVRICCGDWSRVCGQSPTVKQGLTAVFLDPPYAVADRADCYDGNDSRIVAHAVRDWAIEHGRDKRMRIAICGYDGEHAMPPEWDCKSWKAAGGYSSQASERNGNCERERIWFSPHTLRPDQKDLFSMLEHE